MADSLPADSVGLVEPARVVFEKPFELACGQVLPRHELVYETYGELNADGSNAVLVCHALSGHHHAAGYHHAEDRKPGWWEACIGPGKPIDTRRFFVVACNNLGGCHGSTGPASLNPETNRVYGSDFPVVTVRDWVRSQALLADHLGIACWAAVVGGSLGGMQAIQWSIDLPERVRHVVAIASTPRLSAQNIAFNEIARQAILSDPAWADGRYLETGSAPVEGLRLARMVGHVTYQSDDGLREKFGREVRSGDLALGRDVQFQVESYLQYQGRSFSKSFDANTYLLMTRALDYFDPAREFGDDLVAALEVARADFMVISFTTDWRFSSARSRELVHALLRAGRNASHADIDAPQGHDAFLLPIPRYLQIFGGYMGRVAAELEAEVKP
ncbi:MAG: homoserine O-acetyltransferase [Pseudomonadales bacterium]|jgi:homoserine O-acetyltransferase|nr:homoserine O-acetyltransferase [Pseudomonadales bacterium]